MKVAKFSLFNPTSFIESGSCVDSIQDLFRGDGIGYSFSRSVVRALYSELSSSRERSLSLVRKPSAHRTLLESENETWRVGGRGIVCVVARLVKGDNLLYKSGV